VNVLVISASVLSKNSYSSHDLVCTTYLSTEADMKRELERKEQEKKRSPKVDFISSGVQPPINPSIAKISGMVHIIESCALFEKLLFPLGNLVILIVCFAAAISAAAAAVAGASGPVAAESVQKDARPNKKSKWDKVSNSLA
jgi:hypothetical protein